MTAARLRPQRPARRLQQVWRWRAERLHWLLALPLVLVAVLLALLLQLRGRPAWPALVAQRALVVGPGELWTARRGLQWVRVGLPATARTRPRRGVRDRAGELTALLDEADLRQERLVLYPLASGARQSPTEWLGWKEALELRPGGGPARASGSLAQLMNLSECRGSAAPARARAARHAAGGCSLLLLGADLPVGARSSVEDALLRVRLLKGRSLLVPGPQLALQDLAASGLAQLSDGLAVYAPSEPGGAELDGEALYREAVAYSGLGLRLAAVAVGGERGGGGATQILASAADIDGLVEALDERRSVALRGLPDLEIDFPALGRVLRTGEVDLRVELSRHVERIEIWRERERVAWVEGARRLEHQETLTGNAAFTLRLVDGAGAALSSAVWYEPEPSPLPDLVVEADSLVWEDGAAQAVLHNRGSAGARFVELRVRGREPGRGPAEELGRVEVYSIAPGEALPVVLPVAGSPRLLYVEAGSAIPARPLGESEVRNNVAVLPLWGARLLRWEEARQLRLRRAEARMAKLLETRVRSR